MKLRILTKKDAENSRCDHNVNPDFCLPVNPRTSFRMACSIRISGNPLASLWDFQINLVHFFVMECV